VSIENQRDQSPITINLEDTDVPPSDAPIEDRVDRARTREVREALTRRGKPVQVVQAAHVMLNASHGGILEPTPDLVKRVLARSDALGETTCGTCLHFDYEGAQRAITHEGLAKHLLELYGIEVVRGFGDWRRWGMCRSRDGLVQFLEPGAVCRDYRPRKSRGTLGTMVAGIWRRINDF
jgi:hypothetical protein